MFKDVNQMVDKYETFLQKNKLVKTNQLSYFVNWLRKYVELTKNLKLTSRSESIDRFLCELMTSGQYEPWQMDQAHQAVLLFYNNFLAASHLKPGAGRRISTQAQEEILPRVVERLRMKHYAYKTEQNYLYWIKSYLSFCGSQSADVAEALQVKHFLSHLALRKKVAAATQNQAFNALLFLFRYGFGIKLKGMADTVRAKGTKKFQSAFPRRS